MHDVELRVKAAVLRLKRFTVPELCQHSSLRRAQVDPIIGQLKKEGVLVVAEGKPAGERRPHRPAAELELADDVSLVQPLADEIYGIGRLLTFDPDLSNDPRVLGTLLDSAELATEGWDTAVAGRQVAREQLRRAGRLLQTVHGYLEAETFKTCLSLEELEVNNHALGSLWRRWRLCTEQLDAVAQRWNRTAIEGAPDSTRGLQLSTETLPKLQAGFEKLEQLSTSFDRMDPTASYVAKELLRRFPRYELCAIQRIRPDSVIETVVGEGKAQDWVGLSKHRVAKEKKLRDIQADVVLRCRAEVIRGRDPRLDAYLFKRFEHDALVRIFVPLVVFRDSQGRIRDSPKNCWQVTKKAEKPHGQLVLELDPPSDLKPEAFGTVECGFVRKTEGDDVGREEARKIADYVTEHAKLLYEHSLDFALEDAVERIRDLADGDSAVLQLLGPAQSSPECLPYVFTRRGHQGKMARFGGDVSEQVPPRAHALGRGAAKINRFVEYRVDLHPDGSEEVHLENAAAYAKENVTTIVAFPLNMGPEDAIAYVYYQNRRAPDQQALNSAWMLTKRCSQVFGAALERDRVRDRAQQMSALNRILMSLLAPRSYATPAELGEAIVWNAHNFLAADVVALYEYDQKKERFTGGIQIAGRLKDPKAGAGPVTRDDVRWSVLASDTGRIFSTDVRADDLLNGSKKADGSPSFIQREEIESTAAIVLKDHGEVVGVLFASFRAPRGFSQQEQEIIALLADGSAAALKKLRHTAPATKPPRHALSVEAPIPIEMRSDLPPDVVRVVEEAVFSYEMAPDFLGAPASRPSPRVPVGAARSVR
jgi:hypothetical protein